MQALIVVDVQYDFLPGGALAVPDGDKIIPIINDIQDDYDVVVATQDWHPAGHQSFASAHQQHKPFDTINLHGLKQVLWPDHCIQGSWGALLSDQLDTRRFEAVFRKGTEPTIDSYSGFFDNGKRKRTGLSGYLQDRGITTISICGLAADYCVYYTAIDGLDLGFETRILNDAVRPIDPVDYAKKQQLFIERGGKVVNA